MTLQEILSLRLHNLQLTATTCTTPRELVARMCAIQAQDYYGSRWAIALRLPGNLTEVDMEQAVIDRQIVRSWPMRCTIHFMAPEDVRWMVDLLAPRVIRNSASRYRQLDLDERIFRKSEHILRDVLKGDKQLTRKELVEALEEQGIDTSDQRGYHITVYAAMDGLICFGPLKGKQATFALTDEWLPSTIPKQRNEALAEVAHRYFMAHGPATVKDFAWWTGLTMADARAGIALADKKLCSITAEGQEFWLSPELAHASTKPTDVFMLPGFDEYMIGYDDRMPQLQDNAAYMPPKNGVFANTIVSNGKVCGEWRRTIKSKVVIIEHMLFEAFNANQRNALDNASRRYAQYVGLQPTIVVKETK